MKRVDRPIRLYVLTIFIVVAYGIMPFISVFLVDARMALLIGLRNLPLNGSILFLYDSNGEANFILLFVSLFLCIFTAASAIWAFYDGAGRFAALILVTVDVLWWSGIVVYAIANSENNVSDKLGWAMQVLIPPIWLGFVWWNFTRADLNAYYSFNSQDGSN